MSDIEETINRIKTHKSVQGIVICNNDGQIIRSTYGTESKEGENIARTIPTLAAKAKSTVRDLDPNNELTFLRIKSKNNEIMVAPDKEFLLIVVQGPKEEKGGRMNKQLQYINIYMQQINQIADHLYLIQQGNNSYIHRQLGESDTVVIKSVFHAQLFMEDDSACHSVHQRECQDLQNEWKILSQLNHPNIIKTQQFIPNHQLDPAGGNLQCCSLFLENASCDLHTLCKSNETSFKIIIKYFTQISIAVEYLHSQYIAHNDIKLENMLVIDRNVIKLADFGFSYRPSYEDLLSKWLPRTLTSYSSPEIVNFRINVVDGEYDEFCLFASDVYALTTALFLAVYKRPPIMGQFPTVDDQYYQLLINQPDLFWQLDFIQKVDSQLMREHTPKQLLENLKDLIEGGLADEYNRITIQEFVNHEFFKYAKQIEGEQI